MSTNQGIESVLQENRSFPPPAEFAAQAHLRDLAEYEAMYKRSIDDPAGFWGEVAQDFHWFKPHEKVVEWSAPDAKWFVGAQTNVCYNCLDLQIERGRGNHPAIVWEGEPGESRTLTFTELRDEVCRFANVLKSLGVKKGDRVTLYMPMVPELAIAMLACARIGAPHSIIFGGFSATAISDRVEDADSKIVITADGGWRRGTVVPLKKNVDEAADLSGLIEKMVVVKRTGNDVAMQSGRDVWWHELMAKASTECPAEPCDSEDLLFILYTSGTTGKPKGIMHTTAGYMVYTALTSKYVFDLHPDDVYWCTADIGWITGHSYVVYGILQNGVTSLMYEGAPNHPDWDRFWRMVERHKVTKFYTAPTAIRAFMKQGRKFPDQCDLSSLKLLGTVGEPINPEAWMWYHEVIGRTKCPIVDTYWQTETGGIIITPLPGLTSTKPGSATRPFFGIDAAVLDEKGQECRPGQGGFLAVRKPWPGMLRGIYGDPERFKNQYWSTYPGTYFTADASQRDADGYFWLMGRVDDVINVSGHRLGTMEVESAIVSHPQVAEAAVVGMPHEIKGQGLAAFITLRAGNAPTEELKKSIVDHVANEIGAIAKPDQVRFTDALPKTRSGKIMRRLLKELATSGDVKGDTTTLEDFSVIANLRASDEG
ncbi:MAG TPA: acetate--CoA ligase [Phycisphaerae bacterium]|nr:acetate--CoA ligase [Phycisphaerae bacterium]